MRLARAVEALPSALLLALGAAAVTLAVRKLWPDGLSEPRARALLVGAGLSVLLAVGYAFVRRLAPHAGTLRLDQHHGLRGRLTNAVELAASGQAERSVLAELAIEDACASVAKLEPRRAVPLGWPRGAGPAAGMCCGVALLALLYVPRLPPVVAAAPVSTIEPLEMPPDDLQLFKDALAELQQQQHSPEVQAAIDRFNQLVEDVANRRLNREEAFRRMEEIERDLLKGAEADKMALQEALKETAEELQNSELAEPLAKSLAEQKLAESEKQLRELAEKLRRPGNQKPDKKQLEKLRRALEAATARRQEALEAINEKRAELRDDLLKKKQQQPDGGAPDPKEQSLLEKKKRELERLDREAERRERAGRALSKLDRDLAKAAEDLMRDLGLSAEDLEQAAEDLNRLDQEQMSEQEKEQLRQRLEELRELIRQQGQGGQKRMARMLKFGQRARGNRGGQRGQRGQEGDGQQPGKEGELRPGKGGAGEEEMLVIGPGGKPIPMLGPGSGSQGSQGSDGAEQGGDPNQPGGKGIGHEAGGNPMGKEATDPKMSTQDVEAQGLDGKGPTNAEVILAAAERGFGGGRYKNVYREYRTVAEDQIEKEDIPDGYRFYVRRYFQLIRPRE